MESIIVVCEDCGKKYRVNLDKVPEGKETFNCLACEHVIPIPKTPDSPSIPESIPIIAPEPDSEPQSVDATETGEDETEQSDSIDLVDRVDEEKSDESSELEVQTLNTQDTEPVGEEQILLKEGEKEDEQVYSEVKIDVKPFFLHGVRLGLSSKLSLFVIVPLMAAFAFAALFSLKQMTSLGDKITKDSLSMVTKMAEHEIIEYTKAVAVQVQLFLQYHPELKPSDFQKDMEFSKIAVQRLSLTMKGFTSIYDVSLMNGVWRYWSHIDPNFINKSPNEIKPLLRNDFEGFERIMNAGKNGNIASGYYSYKDEEGHMRDNFMALVPVKGTTLYVASTAYFDESTLGVVPQPMSQNFKEYLEMISWPQDKSWWKIKY